MQYLSLGTYGTVEPFGARARDVKTNSGEGSLERCSSKADFHGAGGVVSWAVVPDIVRRKERRRRVVVEAMVVEACTFSYVNCSSRDVESPGVIDGRYGARRR